MIHSDALDKAKKKLLTRCQDVLDVEAHNSCFRPLLVHLILTIWLEFNVLSVIKKILFGKTSFTSANIPSLIHRLS